jgi:hypothetical protein
LLYSLAKPFSLAKPPWIWLSYRLAFVQSQQSLYAPDYCPNKPPNEDQGADRKMGGYRANDQIEQPYPKRGYLKLKMRATQLVGFISLQISDDYADESRYAGEKSNQVQNVNGKNQSVVWNDRRFDSADGLVVASGALGHVLTPRLGRKNAQPGRGWGEKRRVRVIV